MHTQLNSTDKVTAFSIVENILLLKYGNMGVLAGVVEFYDITDSKPCLVNLGGANFSVGVYFKSVAHLFESEAIMIQYIQKNVRLNATQIANKDIVVDDTTITEDDMKAAFDALKINSGIDIKF